MESIEAVEPGASEDEAGGFASLLPGDPENPAGLPRKKPIVLDDMVPPLTEELEDPFVPEFATEIALPEIEPGEMGLGDWLAAARELAAVACTSEDRTR